MPNIFEYEMATGKVLFTTLGNFVAGELPDTPFPANDIRLGDADWTQYVNPATDVLEARPAMAATIDKTTVAAGGVDYATVTNVPSGAEVLIAGQNEGVSDGTDVELTFDISGQYVVKISLFPYLDWKVTINAN